MPTEQNGCSFILALISYLLIIEVSGLPVNAEEVSECVVSYIYFILYY